MESKKTNRREFVKQVALVSAAITSGLSCSAFIDKNYSDSAKPATGNKSFPVPTLGQITWQDCEVGMIFHFDISVAVGEHTRSNNAYKEVFDPQKYNPEKLNTDQWIEAAKAAGARYAIFTATHFNGFLQWQSEAYPYGLKQAKWRNGKGDIVGDFVTSCHKAGIKPGIYLSTNNDAYWHLWDHYVDWGKGKGSAKQAEFNRAAETMVEELCSKYGPLVQIWFDAGTKLPYQGGPDVLPIFDKYQPGSVFYNCTKRSDHRWIGNEAGYANYPCWATMPGGEIISHNAPSWKPILGTGDPNGTIWSPGMVDVPLRGANGIHNWLWAPGQDAGALSKEKLVEMYYTSVGRNCNLVIGEVITPEGLVPESDITRLKEFGDEIKRRFSNPVASTSGKGNSIILEIPAGQRVNHLIIQENISKGEKVREYTVESRKNGNWTKLCDGQSIGHKRIPQTDTVESSALRLTITKSIAEPDIKLFSAFYVE
jgi:alpha-L-fucosidase